MKIDELSGYLLIVEETNPTKEMEHVFSTRHRGSGRSKGKYQNQNRHPQQSQNYQGNAST
jgi:hypothetical protein